MTAEETSPSFAPEASLIDEYRTLAEGGYAEGTLGRLLFVVSTADLAMSRGDLYVGLGLAKYLRRLGWGITLWPTERWTEESPEGFDAAIVMIESFVPGLIHPDTPAIAWVRNWTERWAALPYLDAFAEVWCSSAASAQRMREVYAGPVEVVPLATDPELFHRVDVPAEAGVVTTANFWGVDRGLIAALREVGRDEKVTWFGKNARFLELPDYIDHRHTIDYFRLPGVYSAWQFVVDDVIEAAAIYGTQNSRLFDATACGALVITNTASGLAELGLEDALVYDTPEELATLVHDLRADPPRAAALADRLRAIVLDRHTYAVRAEAVSGYLARRSRATGQRTELLRWVTRLREEFRAKEFEHADLGVAHYDQGKQLQLAHRRIELLELVIENQPGRRLRRYLRYLVRPRALIARLRNGRQ